jgi:hypothetical protein
MPDPTTITGAIEQAALDGVQRIVADGVAVDAMDIEKQIKADQHVSGRKAAGKNHFGLRFVKLSPPGAG